MGRLAPCFRLCLCVCLCLCLAPVVPALGLEAIQLTVWGPQGDQDILAALIYEYKKERPDQRFDITLQAVEEPDVWTRYKQDSRAMADIFIFVGDRLMGFAEDGALLPVGRNRQGVIDANTPTSVESATVNGALYAYPLTEDNGYFLYYDNSVLTSEDVKTLDAILEKADASGKKVYMDIANGWYVASFFFGAGCRLYIDAAGRQNCDFNSDAGIEAGEAVRAFTASPSFLSGGDATLVSGIGEDICAGVSGIWNADAIRRKLGSKYSACKLPTYTLNGQQAQMGSFIGTKLVGVSARTAHPREAEDMAAFLTGERAQILRFKVRAMRPSNIKAAAFQEVRDNIALIAFADQKAYGVNQKFAKDAFWEPAKAFGEAMESHSQEDMGALLDEMVTAIQNNEQYTADRDDE